MFSYLAVGVALIIAFYTVLYGWEILKSKNYGGFIAVVFLAVVSVALPVYLLLFKS